MKLFRWSVGVAALAGYLYLALFTQLPLGIGAPDLPHIAFSCRSFAILILAALLCLCRVICGPTPADRIVAIEIFGVLVIGACAILCTCTGRSWYIDIGIAWGLQSFIGTMALAKHLEGRAFDD